MSRASLRDQSFIFLDGLVHLLKIKHCSISAILHDCIKELASPISTSTGVSLKDILRFFHGDGPAQQYEAACGNSVGGKYPCVGCGVESTYIHILAFKCRTRTLKERQEFILNGNAWRNGGIKFKSRSTQKGVRHYTSHKCIRIN